MYEDLNGKRYINLVRCSTDGQKDTNIPAQLALLTAFAAKHGMIHVDTHHGESEWFVAVVRGESSLGYTNDASFDRSLSAVVRGESSLGYTLSAASSCHSGACSGRRRQKL